MGFIIAGLGTVQRLVGLLARAMVAMGFCFILLLLPQTSVWAESKTTHETLDKAGEAIQQRVWNIKRKYRYKYDKFWPEVKKEIALAEQRYGKDSPKMVPFLLEIWGNAYQKDHVLGTRIMERIIAIRAKTFGETGDKPLESIATLAAGHKQFERYKKAEQTFRRLLKLVQKKHGPNDEIIALTLHNIAEVEVRQNDWNNCSVALVTYQKAAAIADISMKTRLMWRGEANESIGYCAKKLGKYELSETAYHKALKLFMAMDEKKIAYVSRTLRNLADVYRALNKPEKARQADFIGHKLLRQALGDIKQGIEEAKRRFEDNDAFLQQWAKDFGDGAK